MRMKSHAVRNVVIVSLLVLTSSAALQAADTLVIKVIDKATGKPMPGIKLTYRTHLGNIINTSNISLGAKGEAFLSWAGVNKYQLVFQFTLDGQKCEIYRTVLAADANAGAITLEIPTSWYKKPLIVTLVDSATVKPLANSRIDITFVPKRMNSGRTLKRDTSAKGEAVFRWVGEGKYNLHCRAINGRQLFNHRPERTLTEADWKAGRITWKIDVPRLSARVKVFILSKGKKTPAPDGMVLRIESKMLRKPHTYLPYIHGKCKNGETTFYGLKVGPQNIFHSAAMRRGITSDMYAMCVVIDAKPWIFKGKILDLTVTLMPHSEYRGELAIKVVDEKGASISDATVTLRTAGKKIKGKTAANGVAAFKDLKAGEYSCKVEKKGYRRTHHWGMRLPGSKEATITLQKQYALDVTVLDRNGKPADIRSCIALGISSKKHSQRAQITDKDKSRIKLPRGKYLIVVFKRINGVAERASTIVDVPADKSVKLVLRKPHAVNIQIIAGKEKMRGHQLFFVSPDQKDITVVSGANNKTALMFKGTYLVFYGETNGQFVMLGERTVTGPGTMKFDLSDSAMKKAPRFSSREEVFAHLLPKEHRPKTESPSTMPARATSRPAR